MWRALIDAGFCAVLLYRIGAFCVKRRQRLAAGVVQRIMLHWCHCAVSVRADIGPGFAIRHVGSIVIGGHVKVGSNFDIRQGVTLGGNRGRTLGARSQPVVGDDVVVGAGAKLLGPITVGDSVFVGANAVVIDDVPDHAVVAGVPARLIRLNGQPVHGERPGLREAARDLESRLDRIEETLASMLAGETTVDE